MWGICFALTTVLLCLTVIGPTEIGARDHLVNRSQCSDLLCCSELQIPDMLGVVLSSSKYGVRQARGKYGMGAKMALIWSKKSTGLPIQVRPG